jgi:hypothetical protein
LIQSQQFLLQLKMNTINRSLLWALNFRIEAIFLVRRVPPGVPSEIYLKVPSRYP